MINFQNYKENIEKKINDYIDNNSKKILIFGEKININKKNTKVINLIDIDESYIYFSKNNNNINFEKNIFDQIISYHGLELLLNPTDFLLNIRKSLVKNGNILFVTYNNSHLSNIESIITDQKNNNINFFDYNLLKDIIKNTGFEIISEEVYAIFLNKDFVQDIIKITKNPYIGAYSFIIKAKKIDYFPFIEGTY
jgi:2-polyprenyl-3-methyl-5-hydroxy-6-metoxy-1,4-benzoquinol methylase